MRPIHQRGEWRLAQAKQECRMVNQMVTQDLKQETYDVLGGILEVKSTVKTN